MPKRSALVRADTVAVEEEEEELPLTQECDGADNNDGSDDGFTPPASPRAGKKRSGAAAPAHVAKKQRTEAAAVGRKALSYATTAVIRSLDEAGPVYDQRPMAHSLRSASFHTRKAIMKQKVKEETEEHSLARRCLHLLATSFTPREDYDYDPSEASHEWASKKDIKEFQALLAPLCVAAKKDLEKDDMILSLPAPCYVLGDLHGNYKDLMFFKRSFWNMGMGMSPARFLFLGDYVDRGPHSVELVAYLFALKIMHPDRVFLLRGNHEFPAQNGEEYYDPCLKQSCEKLFAKRTAQKLWRAINDTFDWMPLAATVDGKIFCCHGGIPRIVQKKASKKPIFERIKAIPRPLVEDAVEERFELVAMDLLWSDPATPEEEEEFGPWFGPNERGGDLTVFGSKAVEKFIEATGCTHIVRAHQPPHHGIELCKSARIVTVFSSSHYCGGFNSAAIVLINEGRLRVATTKAVVDKNPSLEEDSGDEAFEDDSYE